MLKGEVLTPVMNFGTLGFQGTAIGFLVLLGIENLKYNNHHVQRGSTIKLFHFMIGELPAEQW